MRLRVTFATLLIFISAAPITMVAQSGITRLPAKILEVGENSTTVECRDNPWDFKISRRQAEEVGLKPGLAVIAYWSGSGDSPITGLEIGDTTLHLRTCTTDDCACKTSKCKPSCRCPR